MTKKTQTTLLIAAAAGVAIYFITRPRITTGANAFAPTPYGPAYPVPSGYAGYPQTGSTASTITAAAGGITSLINAITNATKSTPAPAALPATTPAYTSWI